jgi:peptidoglycan/LPS O-acetylase OafA/YrhL
MSAASSPVAHPAAATRLRCIDGLRAVSSQLLVWHHLAFYGPLADVAYPLAPVLLDWLVDPARFVVQVFLVIGGYGTAQHLTHVPAAGWRPFAGEIAGRYRRIGIPYVAMLPVAVLANHLAGRWMEHHSISAAPTLPQLAAHALFAQDLLRYEPLTAGIWYLAIDFQLFVLSLAAWMLALRWGGGKRAGRAGGDPAGRGRSTGEPCAGRLLHSHLAILALPAVLSLFWFNRDPAYEDWGLYHLGSYFLGMLVAAAVSGRLPPSVLAGYLGLVVVAVAVDWRPRLLVAAAAAGLILLASRLERLPHAPDGGRLGRGIGRQVGRHVGRLVGSLARISFSLFLVHFPVCLVVSGWLSRWPLTPTEAFAGMVAAWGGSLLVAIAFHHAVERPCSRAAPVNAARSQAWKETGRTLSTAG